MQRSNRTSTVNRLFAAIAVGMMSVSVACAEPWSLFPKSKESASSGSTESKDSKNRIPGYGAGSKLDGTKPTLANRLQVAPTNPIAQDDSTSGHWWQRLRNKPKAPVKNIRRSNQSKASDEIPIVAKKSRAAVSGELDRSPLSQISAPNDSREEGYWTEFDTNAATDEKTVPHLVENPSARTASVKASNNSKTGVHVGHFDSIQRRTNRGVKPVAFDEAAESSPEPPIPGLRRELDNINVELPFEEKGRSSKIQLRQSKTSDEMISLTVRDAPLSVVLSLIAEQHGLNLVAGSDVDGRVTVTLNDVELDEALNALLTVNGYSWHRNRNILVVSKVASESRSSPMLRGVVMRVFRLNYISAIDVEKVVTTLLSPAGRSVTTVVDIKSTRRTREEIVVEDLPEYVERIGAYISEVDRAPRQVLIEAHILQVNLKDNSIHGVNLQKLFDIGNTQVSLQTKGFANPLASPAFFFGIDNNDFHSLVQALTTQTDSKTLATPRVLCLNGQHAKIHIGEQLGFLVTTTTQTSTLQNVNFLNVGVILDVTPVITDEGLVMLHVKPEVSGGQINPNGLPSANTTEVETTVMLADGHGMIIGGLIKEEDTDIQTKVPYLGDLWVVGRLFQQRSVLRQRNEIIIALIPHILPHPDDKIDGCDDELQRVRTPLLSPPLERMDRRQWEPDPPDAVRNSKHLFSGEILRRIENPYGNGIPDDGDQE